MNEERRKEIRSFLKGDNIYRWLKLQGELRCDTNEETLNAIVKELDRRIEKDKADKSSSFHYSP